MSLISRFCRFTKAQHRHTGRALEVGANQVLNPDLAASSGSNPLNMNVVLGSFLGFSLLTLCELFFVEEGQNVHNDNLRQNV